MKNQRKHSPDSEKGRIAELKVFKSFSFYFKVLSRTNKLKFYERANRYNIQHTWTCNDYKKKISPKKNGCYVMPQNSNCSKTPQICLPINRKHIVRYLIMNKYVECRCRFYIDIWYREIKVKKNCSRFSSLYSSIFALWFQNFQFSSNSWFLTSNIRARLTIWYGVMKLLFVEAVVIFIFTHSINELFHQ